MTDAGSPNPIDAIVERVLETALANVVGDDRPARLERAIAALRADGYVVVPDPAGFLRVRRRRSAHI